MNHCYVFFFFFLIFCCCVCVCVSVQVTYGDIDDLFFNTGPKNRYTDPSSPQLVADDGALSGFFTSDGVPMIDPLRAKKAAYARMTFKEAIDLNNGIRADLRVDAAENLTEEARVGDGIAATGQYHSPHLGASSR